MPTNFEIAPASLSADVMNWSAPTIVTSPLTTLNKKWIAVNHMFRSVLDSSPSTWSGTSEHTCQWSDLDEYFTDEDHGVLLWNTASSTGGIGGQPVVQPNGSVVVPIMSSMETRTPAFTLIRTAA